MATFTSDHILWQGKQIPKVLFPFHKVQPKLPPVTLNLRICFSMRRLVICLWMIKHGRSDEMSEHNTLFVRCYFGSLVGLLFVHQSRRDMIIWISYSKDHMSRAKPSRNNYRELNSINSMDNSTHLMLVFMWEGMDWNVNRSLYIPGQKTHLVILWLLIFNLIGSKINDFSMQIYAWIC